MHIHILQEIKNTFLTFHVGKMKISMLLEILIFFLINPCVSRKAFLVKYYPNKMNFVNKVASCRHTTLSGTPGGGKGKFFGGGPRR
jgi:hypothetical protein